MGDFLDELLERRIDFNEGPEGKFAGRLRGQLEEARREVLQKVKSLKPFTNIEGKFIDNAAARASAKAVADDISGLLKETDSNLVKVLKEGKASAFKRGAVDVQFATDVGGAGKVSLGKSFSQTFDAALPKAANSKVLGVGPTKEFKGATRHMRTETKKIITQAVANGESIDKTAEKIDKVMNTGKRSATRIARTNLNAALNDGHRAVYDSNPDIYKGYRWDATLDSRTSNICAALHGTFYPLNSNPPGPPAHPNCRSVLVGVLRDDEAQEIIDNSTRRVRKPDGKTELIKSDTKFDDWLQRQPEDTQRKIIDSELKLKLWKQKKIKLTDMLSDGINIRKDKDVVARALARRPKDDALKNLAKELNVTPINAEELLAADLREAKRAEFNVGVRPGTSKRVAELREKIDLRKKGTDDFISRGALKVSKEEGKLIARKKALKSVKKSLNEDLRESIKADKLQASVPTKLPSGKRLNLENLKVIPRDEAQAVINAERKRLQALVDSPRVKEARRQAAIKKLDKLSELESKLATIPPPAVIEPPIPKPKPIPTPKPKPLPTPTPTPKLAPSTKVTRIPGTNKTLTLKNLKEIPRAEAQALINIEKDRLFELQKLPNNSIGRRERISKRFAELGRIEDELQGFKPLIPKSVSDFKKGALTSKTSKNIRMIWRDEIAVIEEGFTDIASKTVTKLQLRRIELDAILDKTIQKEKLRLSPLERAIKRDKLLQEDDIITSLYNELTINSRRKEIATNKMKNKLFSRIKVDKPKTFKTSRFTNLNKSKSEIVEENMKNLENIVNPKLMTEEIREINVFLDTPKSQKTSVDRFSASYSNTDKTIHLTKVRSNRVDELYHEWGHQLEQRSPKVDKLARDFFKARTKNDFPRKLSDITGDSGYDRSERAKPDRFMDPYIGKIYNSGTTEIISMGIEALMRDPVKFMRADPEHFELILDTLAGRFR